MIQSHGLSDGRANGRIRTYIPLQGWSIGCETCDNGALFVAIKLKDLPLTLYSKHMG